MFRLNNLTLSLCFLLTLSLRAFAQEGIYGLTEIDYFNQKGLKKSDQRQIHATIDKKEPPIDQDLWIEPAVSADGKVSYYKPPQVVTDFLDDPSMENGKKYIEWNQKKLEKIQKAQGVLQELAKEMNMIPTLPEASVTTTPNPQIKAEQNNNVVFFLLHGCPYCEKQKELIIKLFSNRPDIHLEVYVKNYPQDEIKELPFPAKEDTGQSRQLGLNTYPSVLIANKYGKKIIIPGLIDESFFKTLLEQKQ